MNSLQHSFNLYVDYFHYGLIFLIHLCSIKHEKTVTQFRSVPKTQGDFLLLVDQQSHTKEYSRYYNLKRESATTPT